MTTTQHSITNCLVVGLQSPVMYNLAKLVAVKNVQIFVATNLPEVEQAFTKHTIHLLIMGGGLPLEERLAIAGYAFQHSEATSVHMKDRSTGPEGFPSFVKEMLTGWLNYNKELCLKKKN